MYIGEDTGFQTGYVKLSLLDLKVVKGSVPIAMFLQFDNNIWNATD